MDEHDLDADPLEQFAAWYADASAAGVTQPEAIALATVSVDGAPSVRMVLLKGHDARGFTFYTNRASRKAAELQANPRAALVFHWQPLHRQVRVEGTVGPIGDDESAAYFATRPRASQVAAWASPQSQPVADREELDRLYASTEATFADGEIPLPPHWGGYRLDPQAIEFWQGRDNRFHDRVRYERRAAGSAWTRQRLAP